MRVGLYVQRVDFLRGTSCLQTAAVLKQGQRRKRRFPYVIVLRDSLWFIDTLQTIMKPYRRAKHRYEIVIGEKGLAVLKTGCLLSQSGSWTYRLLGHNRYEPSGACTGRECGEKWSTGRYITLQTITIFRISCEPPLL